MVYRRIADRQLHGAKWHLAAKQQRAASSEPRLRGGATVADDAVLGHVVHWLDPTEVSRHCETGGDLPGFISNRL